MVNCNLCKHMILIPEEMYYGYPVMCLFFEEFMNAEQVYNGECEVFEPLDADHTERSGDQA